MEVRKKFKMVVIVWSGILCDKLIPILETGKNREKVWKIAFWACGICSEV
jgi:hypothetical protein